MDTGEPEFIDLQEVERLLEGGPESEESFSDMLQDFLSMKPTEARFHMGTTALILQCVCVVEETHQRLLDHVAAIMPLVSRDKQRWEDALDIMMELSQRPAHSSESYHSLNTHSTYLLPEEGSDTSKTGTAKASLPNQSDFNIKEYTARLPSTKETIQQPRETKVIDPSSSLEGAGWQSSPEVAGKSSSTCAAELQKLLEAFQAAPALLRRCAKKELLPLLGSIAEAVKLVSKHILQAEEQCYNVAQGDLYFEEVLDEAFEEQIFLLENRREDSSECEMWQRMLWGGHLAFEQQALECREAAANLFTAPRPPQLRTASPWPQAIQAPLLQNAERGLSEDISDLITTTTEEDSVPKAKEGVASEELPEGSGQHLKENPILEKSSSQVVTEARSETSVQAKESELEGGGHAIAVEDGRGKLLENAGPSEITAQQEAKGSMKPEAPAGIQISSSSPKIAQQEAKECNKRAREEIRAAVYSNRALQIFTPAPGKPWSAKTGYMLEEATALEGQWKPNPYVTRPVKKAKKPAAGKDVTIGLINGRAARSSNSSQPRGRMGTPSREKQAQKSSNNQQSLLQTPGPDKKQQDSGRDTVAIDQENGHTEPASGLDCMSTGKSLQLEGSGMTAKDLKQQGRSATGKVLQLEGSGMTAKDLEQQGGNATGKNLQLEGSGMTAKDLKQRGGNATGKSLQLEGSGMTAKDLDAKDLEQQGASANAKEQGQQVDIATAEDLQLEGSGATAKDLQFEGSATAKDLNQQGGSATATDLQLLRSVAAARPLKQEEVTTEAEGVGEQGSKTKAQGLKTQKSCCIVKPLQQQKVVSQETEQPMSEVQSDTPPSTDLEPAVVKKKTWMDVHIQLPPRHHPAQPAEDLKETAKQRSIKKQQDLSLEIKQVKGLIDQGFTAASNNEEARRSTPMCRNLVDSSPIGGTPAAAVGKAGQRDVGPLEAAMMARQKTSVVVGPLAAGMQQIHHVLNKPAPLLEESRMEVLLQKMKSLSTAELALKEAKTQIEEMNHPQELEACLSQILLLEGCLPFEARRRFSLCEVLIRHPAFVVTKQLVEGLTNIMLTCMKTWHPSCNLDLESLMVMTVSAIAKAGRINGKIEAEAWLCTSLLIPLLEAASSSKNLQADRLYLLVSQTIEAADHFTNLNTESASQICLQRLLLQGENEGRGGKLLKQCRTWAENTTSPGLLLNRTV